MATPQKIVGVVVGNTEFYLNLDDRGSVLVINPVSARKGIVFSAAEWADITTAIKEGHLDGEPQ